MFTGIKRYFIVFLIFICSVPLFAVEEYVAKIYKEIDHIFIIKSEDELNTVLSENNHDKYYYLIENYTEKKIGLKLPIPVTDISDYDLNAPFLD